VLLSFCKLANVLLTPPPTCCHLQPSIVPDSSLLNVYKELRDSTDNLAGLAGAGNTDGAHAAGTAFPASALFLQPLSCCTAQQSQLLHMALPVRSVDLVSSGSCMANICILASSPACGLLLLLYLCLQGPKPQVAWEEAPAAKPAATTHSMPAWGGRHDQAHPCSAPTPPRQQQQLQQEPQPRDGAALAAVPAAQYLLPEPCRCPLLQQQQRPPQQLPPPRRPPPTPQCQQLLQQRRLRPP
jgi:hypothetical protein